MNRKTRARLDAALEAAKRAEHDHATAQYRDALERTLAPAQAVPALRINPKDGRVFAWFRWNQGEAR